MLKTIVHKALACLGYRLSKIRLEDDRVNAFFACARTAGFNPACIFDVGANRGHWTRKALHYFPAARFELFEPQAFLRIHADDLLGRNPNIRWNNCAVADFGGEAEFTPAASDVSSHFSRSGAINGEQIKVRVAKLDTFCSKRGIYPQIMKIDAQGADLKVLDGGRSLLGLTELILIEAAVCAPLLENTALEVMNRMDSEGYRLVGIADLNHSPRHDLLWLVELVFTLKNCSLFDRFDSYD